MPVLICGRMYFQRVLFRAVGAGKVILRRSMYQPVYFRVFLCGDDLPREYPVLHTYFS